MSLFSIILLHFTGDIMILVWIFRYSMGSSTTLKYSNESLISIWIGHNNPHNPLTFDVLRFLAASPGLKDITLPLITFSVVLFEEASPHYGIVLLFISYCTLHDGHIFMCVVLLNIFSTKKCGGPGFVSYLTVTLKLGL